MAIKDRKRTRFNRLGVIRLGYRVFYCDNGHAKAPTRWNGNASQECSVCGKTRSGLSERSGVAPYQPGHFVLRDAPAILDFYEQRGTPETGIRELEIMFPFAERDRNFIANYQVWTANTVVCEGDGEYVTRASPFKLSKSKSGYLRIRQDTGDTLVNNGMACKKFDWNGEHFEAGDHVPCSGSGEERLYPHCALCKLNSLIKVIMADPELFDVGYYQIATGSGNNYDAFDTMFDILPANVQGVRFRLQMVQEKKRYRGDDGKLHPTEKWFLYLKPMREDLRQMMEQQAARQLGQGIVEEMPQLEAGGDTIELSADDIEDPENTEPPPDEQQGIPETPDFTGWKKGSRWTAFCELVVDKVDYFDKTSQVWSVIIDMHGKPPSCSYGEAWTTCIDHAFVPEQVPA